MIYFILNFRKAEVGLKKVQEVGADGAVVSSNRSTLAYGIKQFLNPIGSRYFRRDELLKISNLYLCVLYTLQHDIIYMIILSYLLTLICSQTGNTRQQQQQKNFGGLVFRAFLTVIRVLIQKIAWDLPYPL